MTIHHSVIYSFIFLVCYAISKAPFLGPAVASGIGNSSYIESPVHGFQFTLLPPKITEFSVFRGCLNIKRAYRAFSCAATECSVRGASGRFALGLFLTTSSCSFKEALEDDRRIPLQVDPNPKYLGSFSFPLEHFAIR